MAAKKILMLVGDYAEDYETMVPFQAQGAAMGIEDAAVLVPAPFGDVGLSHENPADSSGHHTRKRLICDPDAMARYEGHDRRLDRPDRPLARRLPRALPPRRRRLALGLARSHGRRCTDDANPKLITITPGHPGVECYASVCSVGSKPSS